MKLIVTLCIVAAVSAYLDLGFFRLFVVVVAFAVLFCVLVCLILASVEALFARLLNREAKETEQNAGDDPDGLGIAYVWSGKPAEPEKGKKAGESDWLL